MAKLEPYFGPHTGALRIFVGIFQVGSGDFPTFTDYQAAFVGSYSAFGQSGTFTISIALTDQNPSSTSGPCQIILNGKTDKAAKYQVNGPKLTITTVLAETPLNIYPNQNGTQVDNISGHSIWIGP